MSNTVSIRMPADGSGVNPQTQAQHKSPLRPLALLDFVVCQPPSEKAALQLFTKYADFIFPIFQLFASVIQQ